jgi:hypothetical protein
MSVSVNEKRPGSGAIDSHPQAAMISFIARPACGAALAAEQQSNNKSASDVAFSNSV